MPRAVLRGRWGERTECAPRRAPQRRRLPRRPATRVRRDYMVTFVPLWHVCVWRGPGVATSKSGKPTIRHDQMRTVRRCCPLHARFGAPTPTCSSCSAALWVRGAWLCRQPRQVRRAEPRAASGPSCESRGPFWVSGLILADDRVHHNMFLPHRGQNSSDRARVRS